jgi:hypothetical protein
MKITNADVFYSRESIAKILNLPLPIVTSFKIAQLGSELSRKLTDIDTARNTIINKYGKKDAQGNASVEPNGKNWSAFVTEFNELLAQEIEIDFSDKIVIPSDTKGELEPAVFLSLNKFIGIEDKKNKE